MLRALMTFVIALTMAIATASPRAVAQEEDPVATQATDEDEDDASWLGLLGLLGLAGLLGLKRRDDHDRGVQVRTDRAR